jgi:hypothetical protein
MTPVNYVGDMSTTHSARSSAGSSGPVEIKVEHRLFSFITKNWRGRPLTSYRVVVELIAATTTKSGLKVFAEWDQGTYPKGIKVSDAEVAAVPIKAHKWHGEWNYTITPGVPLTIK